MSQRASQRSNAKKNAQAPEPKKRKSPVTGSPDDPIGVDPDGTTGKPAQLEK